MHKIYVRPSSYASAISVTVLLFMCALPAMAQNRRSTRSRYTVPANTVLRVRMNERLSSKDARIGDQFTATVVDPVYVRGTEVIPSGSTVAGRVTAVKKASRKSEAGSIQVAFTSIRVPRGTVYPVNGSLSDLGEESVNTDDEGGVGGRSSKKRNVAFIGGGAVVGALVNGAAGAAIGGGLGVAGALLSKGKEAEVKPGTEFGVVLNRSVTVNAPGK
jgi:hypothetical protein